MFWLDLRKYQRYACKISETIYFSDEMSAHFFRHMWNNELERLSILLKYLSKMKICATL